MGNCSSCLSRPREPEDEEGAEARLLYGDGDADGYGSFSAPVINVQETAQESQREFEALQRVVARTSDNMVDVFEIAPPPGRPTAQPSPYGLGLPDSRTMQYQALLSKLEVAEDGAEDGDTGSDAEGDGTGADPYAEYDEPTVVVY